MPFAGACANGTGRAPGAYEERRGCEEHRSSINDGGERRARDTYALCVEAEGVGLRSEALELASAVGTEGCWLGG